MGRAAPRLLAAVLLSLCTVPLATVVPDPRPAYAHGRLAVSTPADGGTLSAPVESVSLAFTEQPPPFAYFTVTAPSGVRVDRRWSPGTSIRLDEPVREYQLVDGVWQPQLFHVGYTVQVPVAYWPEQGRYAVRYQTVASDGEEVTGEVRFTYTGAGTPAPAGWQAPTDQPSPELVSAAGHSRPSTGPSVPPSAPASGAAGAPTATPEDGPGPAVWALPALLLVGGAILIVGVARRPAQSGATAARRRSGAASPAARSSPAAPRAASRSREPTSGATRPRRRPSPAVNRRKRR